MKEEKFFLSAVIFKLNAMKKGIFRLIGVIALIVGLSNLYTFYLEIFNPPLSSYSIRDALLAWVAIYGGYQTILLREIGRKLLLIVFLCEIILISLLLAFSFGFIIVSHQDLWSVISPQKLMITSSYLLFCALASIFLSRKNAVNEFQPEHDRVHIETVGKILSVVTPGLGRALIGNTWKGLLLFLVYFFLFTGFHISGTENMEFLQPGLSYASTILDLVIKSIIWWSFFEGDWTYVKTAALPPTEPLYSA